MSLQTLIAGFLLAQLLPSPDFQSTLHVFPQFVDGVVGERAYASTLQISAADFSWPTGCTLRLLAMPRMALVNGRGAVETNTVFNFVMGPSGWVILRSQGVQPLRSGSAVLQCDLPVTAHLIYTQRIDDSVRSETTVSAAPPGRIVQIIADQRQAARLGIAISNPFSTVTTYRISAIDMEGLLIHVSFVQLAPLASFTRFVDEFATLPADFSGPIVIESSAGTEVYASGLRFMGDVFTAIPAMVRVR